MKLELASPLDDPLSPPLQDDRLNLVSRCALGQGPNENLQFIKGWAQVADGLSNRMYIAKHER